MPFLPSRLGIALALAAGVTLMGIAVVSAQAGDSQTAQASVTVESIAIDISDGASDCSVGCNFSLGTVALGNTGETDGDGTGAGNVDNPAVTPGAGAGTDGSIFNLGNVSVSISTSYAGTPTSCTGGPNWTPVGTSGSLPLGTPPAVDEVGTEVQSFRPNPGANALEVVPAAGSVLLLDEGAGNGLTTAENTAAAGRPFGIGMHLPALGTTASSCSVFLLVTASS